MKQESHSSSSSPSSLTVGDIPVREREDGINCDTSPVQVSNLVGDGSGKPEETQANQIPNTNKKETTIERGNLCDDSEIPEWLQEFRENLVDDEIPLQGGSHASSSHEASLEPNQMEDAHKPPKNSQIGMSRHLDSSTTTQMADIMVQYGRPSRSS